MQTSIDYIQKNPINGNPAILTTLRNFKNGAVILIDIKLNKLLWKSENRNLFNFPHDARFTKTGTITFFDNGNFSSFYKKSKKTKIKKKFDYLIMSRAVEYDIKTKKIIWEYGHNLNSYDQYNLFFSIYKWYSKNKKRIFNSIWNARTNY